MSATAQIIQPSFAAPRWTVTIPPMPFGAPTNPLAQLDQIAMAVTFTADAEIFDQDSLVRHCYQITSGCLRTVRLMEDGRRLIDRFLLPGDLLGFAAGTHHDVAAQSVTASTLRRYPVQAVATLAERDADFACFLWQTATAELRAAHDHGLLLGRKTATERVASFLKDMAARIPLTNEFVPGQMALPMGRADIADHLGLTVETVSRTLTQLRCRSVITVLPGKIIVRNQVLLAGLAGEADVHPSARH